jgi:YVTN family beta-propeller protein
MTVMLLAGKQSLLAFAAFAVLPFAVHSQGSQAVDPPKDKPAPPIRALATQLKPDATFDLGGTRGFGSGDGSVWVSLKDTGSVVRIDPKTNKVTQTITVGKPICSGMTFGFGTMWVPLCGASGTGHPDVRVAGVVRIDPKTNAVTATISKGLQSGGPMKVAVSSVWVESGDGTLARIDPASGAVVAEVYMGAGSTGLALGQDSLWITNAASKSLARIDANTNLITDSITIAKPPVDVAFGEGSAWTLNSGDGTVSRVDPKTNKVTETVKLGMPISSGQIAVGEGSVWVSAPGLPLARIDPRTNQVAQIFTGPGGGLLFIGEGSIWIAADAKTVWRLDPKRIEATR